MIFPLLEFLKFSIVGLCSTGTTYAFFYGCHAWLGLHYTISYGLGFGFGIIVGYTLNQLWTFHNKGCGLKYGALYGLSFFISLVILRMLVENFLWEPQKATFFTLITTPLLNFLGLKLWVFKKKN